VAQTSLCGYSCESRKLFNLSSYNAFYFAYHICYCVTCRSTIPVSDADRQRTVSFRIHMPLTTTRDALTAAAAAAAADGEVVRLNESNRLTARICTSHVHLNVVSPGPRHSARPLFSSPHTPPVTASLTF